MTTIDRPFIVNIGKGIEMAIPAFNTFSPEVQAHVMYIGFRNILMDAHAGMTAEKADGGDIVELSRAISQKKLDSLSAGEVRTISFREGDPVKAEAMKLASAAIDAALRKAGKKPSAVDPKVKREKAREIAERFMVQARKNVEASRAEAAELDIDDLMGG